MRGPLIIGIAGGSGSGKSTLAKNLLAALEDAALLTHDDYYKEDNPQSADFNYDHPDAFDNELLKKHLKALSEGLSVDSPIYDYQNHKRSLETRKIEPCAVIIVEGILVLESEELRRLFDLKIFVDTPEEERFRRRLKRDVNKRGRSPESVILQFERTVKPMHELFVEPSKAYADRIVIGGGKDPEVIEDIKRSIEALSLQKIP